MDYRQIDKDPIIDIIRTEAQNDGDLREQHLKHISENSGVSVGTLRNWFFGSTKKPQSITTRFVLDALGVRVRYVRADGTVIRQPRLGG